MPRRPTAASKPDVLDEIRAFRARRDAMAAELRQRRERLVEEIGEIDQALAELGAVAERAVAALAPAPREPVTVAETSRAKKSGRVGDAPVDRRILDELQELKPWIPGLRDRQRQIVTLRLGGKSTAEIASQLGDSVKDVSNAIYAGRARLRELRSRGAPKGETPASDDEGEPAGVAWELLGADGAGYVGPANDPPRAPTGSSRIAMITASAAKVSRKPTGRCERCGLLEPHECVPRARDFARMSKDHGE